MDYQSFLRGSVSVLHSNQPHGGFDCPGCAWPDHKTHKTLDVCETGIKVLASETTSRTADAKFFYQNKVSQLQDWSGYELEHAGRLSEPLCYDSKQDRYLPISWEDAFAKVAEELKKLANPDEALFYTSGRVTNEPAFLYQLMVRCFGTNNLPDCSNMCHEPTSVMLARQLGVGKATVILEDFERAKLILMFGQNPATNHPRMLEMLAHAHKQGCKIISINPMREQGLKAFRNPQKPTHMAAGMSDEMVDNVIQIRVGGDVALLTGIAKWLVENDRINHEFIDNETMLYPATTSLILPCLSRTERYVTEYGEQFATIEDSICQIVATKGHLKPISEHLKSEAEIIAGIALKLLDNAEKSKIDWQKMSTDFDFTRDYIAQAIEGFENFNAKIREHKRGFHLYHPARHRSWKTQSGKAQFELPTHPITLVADRAAKIEQTVNHGSVWQLTSVCSHDQFNTMIFGFEDRYRQTHQRDVLFMHPDEMARIGLNEGERVMVTREDSSGNIRTLGALVLTKMDIAAGSVATYYPECNDLIDLDSHAPESRTPAYKSMTVSISCCEEQGVSA